MPNYSGVWDLKEQGVAVKGGRWQATLPSNANMGLFMSRYASGNGTTTEKVFSSLQLAMYPAISRYADVLISCETRQVRNRRVTWGIFMYCTARLTHLTFLHHYHIILYISI